MVHLTHHLLQLKKNRQKDLKSLELAKLLYQTVGPKEYPFTCRFMAYNLYPLQVVDEWAIHGI